MKKFAFALLLLGFTFGNAAVLNSVIATVNNAPITEFELKDAMKKYKTNRANALNALIRQKLEEEQIRNFNIVTNEYEVDRRIEQIRVGRGWSEARFKAEVKKAGLNWEDFREEIYQNLLKEKLYGGILQEAGRNVTPENVRKFYDQNKHRFSSYSKFSIVHYAGATAELVKRAIANPMTQIPNTQVQRLEVEADKLPAGLRALFEQTPEGKRTQIFNNGRFFEAFMVSEKKGMRVAKFEDVEKQIAQMMSSREQDIFLADYFNKLRAKAVISYK